MTTVDILPVPLIMGIVHALKSVGLPNNILPIANIVFGIGFAVLFNGKLDAHTILSGIVLGLTAAGLYRSQKVVRGIE